MNPPEWPRERREAYRRSRALGEWLALLFVIGVWLLVIIGGAFLLRSWP